MNKVTSKDGTTIAFDQSGAGPALILVTGATADRSTSVSLAEHLAPHFTVFSYDRRGRGDSSDTAPYAVEREIENIAAIIKEAGGSAFVFGHSSGAVLALEIDDSRPPLPADYVAHLNPLIAAGRRNDAVAYLMTAAVGIPAEFVEQMRNEPFWAASEAVAHTIPYDGTMMGVTMSGNPASLTQFAAIKTPTLVMDGGESPPYQHNSVQALVDLLPHAQRRTLAGQDHGPAPEVLAPVLNEFFGG